MLAIALASIPWVLICICASLAWSSLSSKDKLWAVAVASTMMILALRNLDFPASATEPDITDMMAVWKALAREISPPSWVFLEQYSASGWGWSAMPSYVWNMASGTYYGERIVGLLLMLPTVSVVTAVGAAWYGSTAGRCSSALLIAPQILWLSRHFMGLELIILQAAGLWCAYEARKHWFWIIPTALIGALSLTTYMGASVISVALAYSVGSIRRALATVCLIAFLYSPVLWISYAYHQTYPWTQRTNYTCLLDGGYLRSIRSLVTADGVPGAASRPGAATLGYARLGLVASALLGGGRSWSIAGLLSLAPDVIGCGHGRSHRQWALWFPLMMGTASFASHFRIELVAPLVALSVFEGAFQWLTAGSGWCVACDDAGLSNLHKDPCT